MNDKLTNREIENLNIENEGKELISELNSSLIIDGNLDVLELFNEFKVCKENNLDWDYQEFISKDKLPWKAIEDLRYQMGEFLDNDVYLAEDIGYILYITSQYQLKEELKSVIRISEIFNFGAENKNLFALAVDFSGMVNNNELLLKRIRFDITDDITIPEIKETERRDLECLKEIVIRDLDDNFIKDLDDELLENLCYPLIYEIINTRIDIKRSINKKREINITKTKTVKYPLSDLRIGFKNRIITTGFFNTDPSIIVSFKLFSKVMANFAGASDMFSDIILNATDNLSFFTDSGWHKLHEVEYMYIDYYGYCVAFTKNGNDLYMRNPPKNNESVLIKIDSPLDLTVSTDALKNYYLNHVDDFRFLNQFSQALDQLLDSRSQSIKQFNSVSELIRTGKVFFQWENMLHELKILLENASFELKVGKNKTESINNISFRGIINRYL